MGIKFLTVIFLHITKQCSYYHDCIDFIMFYQNKSPAAVTPEKSLMQIQKMTRTILHLLHLLRPPRFQTLNQNQDLRVKWQRVFLPSLLQKFPK